MTVEKAVSTTPIAAAMAITVTMTRTELFFVSDLESQTTICKFNMDKRCITDEQVEVLAEIFLPEIIEFYKDEKNVKMFEEWKKQQDKKKK